MSEDPRKTALKRGLWQLSYEQVSDLIDYLEAGLPVVLDHVNYDERTGYYCPLAIAIGLPGMIRGEVTNQRVTLLLELLGFKVFNTRGVEGEFYTTNRRSDLLTACVEVLKEV